MTYNSKGSCSFLLAGSPDLLFDLIEEPPEVWPRSRRTTRPISLPID